MSNTKSDVLSRRSALKLGLGTAVGLTVFGFSARIVMAADGQVLKVAHPAFSQDWSPLRGGGSPYRWNSAWWASPMRFDAEGNIHPYVFASWEPNGDSTVWTFKIDPAAKFSDGSAITSADVKGSWELAAMPATTSQRVAQVLSGVVGYAEVTGGSAIALSGVATPDDATVVVTLGAPDPIFFMRLANHIAPITKVSQ
ncbi:MAG: ABC transporter substrate-binding protein, partial [Devosia sp.]|nr:ABC transporter substrate-binding protein [Devosia sp.]